jgi:hypothetical protein
MKIGPERLRRGKAFVIVNPIGGSRYCVIPN